MSYVTPKKNATYIFYAGLVSRSTGQFQSTPTIAAGDFKVSTDGGALANLTTLPAVTPAASKMVKFTISATEMNGDNITIVGSDAAGAEWDDVLINIQTSVRQIDDLAYPTTSGRSIDVSTTGEVESNLVQINGQSTAGNNATLSLKQLNITNNSGSALVIQSTGADGNGAEFTGNGAGNGIVIAAGSSGVGLQISSTGIPSGGCGLRVISTNNDAVSFIGGSSFAGLFSYGGTYGIEAEGAIGINALGDDGDGFHAQSDYTGHGINSVGSASGKSINAPQGITGSDSEDLSVTNITDKVWDEAIAGHLTGGTTGAALNGAGSAGDPWGTNIPGAYAAGTAGYILGNNIDGAISNIPTANDNADALLKRDWTTITGEAARSVLNALRKLRNKVSFNGTDTLTVTKEDDTTTAYTQAVTVDDTQDPFKEVG